MRNTFEKPRWIEPVRFALRCVIIVTAAAALLLTILTFLVLVTGCAPAPKPASTPVAVDPSLPVYTVRFGPCGATPIAEGAALTAAHCLRGRERVMRVSPDDDLAIIELDTCERYVQVRRDAPRDVLVQHYAGGRLHVAGTEAEAQGEKLKLVGSHGIAPGASGGGVFSLDGELVGVILQYTDGGGPGYAAGPGVLTKILSE